MADASPPPALPQPSSGRELDHFRDADRDDHRSSHGSTPVLPAVFPPRVTRVSFPVREAVKAQDVEISLGRTKE